MLVKVIGYAGVAAAVVGALVACTAAKSGVAAENGTLPPAELNLPLTATAGQKIVGTVTLIQNRKGEVILHLRAENVSPGLHAAHIHEYPDCSAPDASSAGGHWNPLNRPHGKWGHKNGFHQGDMGVFLADKTGHVDYTFKTTTASWCLGCADPAKNILGHALVVHVQTDDFVTQPTGNAGARVACTVLRPMSANQ